ncbi:hypothetical protein C8J57DRAFT_1459268 [Mycena rebaudengoi]|nr:hypothetical protein C8J57DRAFT_1459268 [Mycena rebaudengoi]
MRGHPKETRRTVRYPAQQNPDPTDCHGQTVDLCQTSARFNVGLAFFISRRREAIFSPPPFMSSNSLLVLELCSAFLSCMLYGVYLVTLGIAARVLLKPDGRTRSRINWITVGVSALLFSNVTLDVVLALHTAVRAFILYTGPGGPETIYKNASHWENYVRPMCVGIQSLIGDAILIYRCWLVYSRSWRIVAFPFVLWLTNIACQVRKVSLQSTLPQGLVTAGILYPWGVAFWTLTICINLSTTPLIVLRIWRVDNEMIRSQLPAGSRKHNIPRSQLGRAMRHVIESGLIYTTAAILTFAAYTSQSAFSYPASVFGIHSVGIAFNLIIIRRSRKPSRGTARAVGQTSLEFAQLQLDLGLESGAELSSRVEKGSENTRVENGEDLDLRYVKTI